MQPHSLRFVLIPIIMLSVFFPIIGTSRALNFSIKQNPFEISDLLPKSSNILTETLSKPLIQQSELLSYFNSSWNLTKLLSYGLSEAIEIICQANIKSASISDSSNRELVTYNLALEASFNQILNTELVSSTEFLNKTATGLFYIWNSTVGNISTSLNLWIAKALLAKYPTDDSSSYLQAEIILNELNFTNREIIPPYYYREYILIDSDENAIPGSLSSFVLLKDQILAMEVLLQLSHGSTDPMIAENLQTQASNMEFSLFHPIDGFIDEGTKIWNKDLSVGYFHSKRNQNTGGTFYIDNRSIVYFLDHVLLLRYTLQQLEAQSEPIVNSLYRDLALKLISDIIITFQGESLFFQGLAVSNQTGESWLDKQLVSEQFEFIDLIISFSDWFSHLNEDLIINDQLKRLIVPLWNYLTNNAYISTEKIVGFGASSQAVAIGYFYSYYSSSLGLFLFGNTASTSLIFANLVAIYALGGIFPYQVTIDYTDFLTKRENQTLEISIVPLALGSGSFINLGLIVNVPAESISKVTVAQVNINPLTTVTIPFSYQITNEGDAVFTVDLIYQGQTFIKIEGKYTTLRTMSVNVEINPETPQKGGNLRITLEARDSVGILRKSVYYYAQIDSESLSSTLWIQNQSLFLENGSINTIDLSPFQTESDLSCYFLLQKSGYYPAELNLTISMQTPLNFLFSWLFWLIFESEIGGYLGTLSAIFALLWGFHTRFVRRITRKIKSCPHCGGTYQTKYVVCSHCGRDISRVSKRDSSTSNPLE